MNSSIEDTLIDLVKTYSPTGHEEKATERFNNYLKSNNASGIRKDAVGNSIGTFPGSGVSVALIGHIDTVPGRLPVTVRDGRLSGRGSVDAKASLISLLYGARMAKEQGFEGTLHVMAAIGEEGPGKGIIEIASSHTKTDYAIFGEPSGTSGITAGYRGRLLLDVSFGTKAYHASAPWLGINAADLAIDAWQEVRTKYGESKEFSKVSAALTSIHAGTADNVTPSHSSLTLDIRFPPSRDKHELFEEFKSLFMSNAGSSKVDVGLRSFVDPYVSNLKTPIVQSFKSAILEKTGSQPKMIFKSGSGDMNILGSRWQVPCITYGPGNPQLSHTDEEEISLEETALSAEIVADALLRLENIHAGISSESRQMDIKNPNKRVGRVK